MFNLINASSKIKKAAYRVGIRSGKYEILNMNAKGGEPFVKVVSKTGKEVILTDIDVMLAEDYTWKEIK